MITYEVTRPDGVRYSVLAPGNAQQQDSDSEALVCWRRPERIEREEFVRRASEQTKARKWARKKA